MKKSIGVFLILLLLSGCATTTNIKIEPPSSISSEHYNFLLTQYAEFTQIYNKLMKSSFSGNDVRSAYDSCRQVITTIQQEEMPLELMPLASALIDGINKYCTGFACYSNKSFCKNDTEATIFMAQGKLILNDFLIDIENMDVSQAILPTKTHESVPHSIDIPTPTYSLCTSWNGISLADVGDTKCVSGKIRQAWYNEEKNAFIITFSADPEALYLIIFNGWTYDVKAGDCVQATGDISQSYNTPVLILQEDQYIYDCY